jgi:hypothetical protein
MNQGGPIDPTETILRRIPGKSDYYNANLDLPIMAIAFRPREDDVDGISLFRERLVSRATLSNSGRRPPYVVAGLIASDILALGLTINPTADDHEIPGHVVIPELSGEAYKQN